jgi:hypothetical protein
MGKTFLLYWLSAARRCDGGLPLAIPGGVHLIGITISG